MTIQARDLHFQLLSRQIRDASVKGPVVVEQCLGQRYIASGMQDVDLTIKGTPGNALGAYLNGGSIVVFGNAQEATGDTMNDGEIIIHGCSGDATGYAMRGGRIFVRDGTGYRAGIHMKAYEDQSPVLMIGGSAGHFLGEYQAGGTIIVLGLDADGKAPVGDFCGTGMHGGMIFLRCAAPPDDLPPQVAVRPAEESDLKYIRRHVEDFCTHFGGDAQAFLRDPFFVLRPNRANPYRQLYTHC